MELELELELKITELELELNWKNGIDPNPGSRVGIMKNTMYTEKKCLIQLISLSQKGYFILYNENKIAFCFKKGRFIGPKNQSFLLKRECFSRPESVKRGYFSSLGTSVVYVLVGSGGGVGVGGWRLVGRGGRWVDWGGGVILYNLQCCSW